MSGADGIDGMVVLVFFRLIVALLQTVWVEWWMLYDADEC